MTRMTMPLARHSFAVVQLPCRVATPLWDHASFASFVEHRRRVAPGVDQRRIESLRRLCWLPNAGSSLDHLIGTGEHAHLESTSARDRLKRGRQPHWQTLIEGGVHLGYQHRKGRDGEAGGRWLLRLISATASTASRPCGVPTTPPAPMVLTC
jgi:hypothetical protein